MPNRILRDWTDSEAVNALSVYAERLFVRLIMKADDYGRMTASPKLLRPMLFPLTLDVTRETDLQRALDEIEGAGLIRRYGDDVKPLLEIVRFNQRTRTASKFPDPSDNGQANCPSFDGQLLAQTETESEAKALTPPPTPAPAGSVRERFELFFGEYPKKAGRERAWIEFRKLDPGPELLARIRSAVGRKAKSPGWLTEDGRYVPKAAEWLADRRWEEVRIDPPAKARTPAADPPLTDEQKAAARQAIRTVVDSTRFPT